MANLVRKNELPDKELFVDLYDVQKLNLNEIAIRFQCSRLRVQKWAALFGLVRRDHTNRMGDGNNRKYHLNKDSLQRMVDDGMSNRAIGRSLGVSKRSVADWLSRYGIQRDYKLDEFRTYHGRVRRLSEKVYKQHIDLINPHRLPRKRCGTPGGYQLDHKSSITYCFRVGISAEECASVANLQMLSWEENLRKRYGD